MTYKTIDWVAEAERVRRAFGIEGECFFDRCPRMQLRGWNRGEGVISDQISITNDITLDHFRAPKESFYYLENQDECWHVEFLADGRVGVKTSRRFAAIFSKALYHLNLLTPEVESALGVSISAHQKLEWELEYAERWGEGAMV